MPTCGWATRHSRAAHSLTHESGGQRGGPLSRLGSPPDQVPLLAGSFGLVVQLWDCKGLRIHLLGAAEKRPWGTTAANPVLRWAEKQKARRHPPPPSSPRAARDCDGGHTAGCDPPQGGRVQGAGQGCQGRCSERHRHRQEQQEGQVMGQGEGRFGACPVGALLGQTGRPIFESYLEMEERGRFSDEPVRPTSHLIFADSNSRET